MRSLLVCLPCLLACASTAAAPEHAQSFEAGAGLSASRERDTTAVASVAWLPEWRERERGLLRGELGATYVRGRNGSRFDNAADVVVFHGGLRYEHAGGLVAGFGVGVQSGSTEALSGGPQFVSTLGWRWDRFSLLARHISNASLHQPNDGETMVLAAWWF